MLVAAKPERRPAIEQLIQATFQVRKAVLALDMSGYSLSVRLDGILSCLRKIRQMQKLTLPLVQANHGSLVKFEADNLLAVFDRPFDAVKAAVAIQRAAQQTAEPNSPDRPLTFSIGIDYGDILLVDDLECFGDPVNLAYKLGEDVAQPGEILITPRVREPLPAIADFQVEEVSLSLNGVPLPAYRVLFERTGAATTPTPALPEPI